jgi:hypothetical protein
MHALCKTLFFTTGTVGLLVLVFLWSALNYGLLKLNYLSDTFLNYKFAGFFLTEFILLPNHADPGLKIHLLKIVISSIIAIGSFYLIIISYLPRLSWQLRSLSFGLALPVLSALSLFWLTLINGHEVIKNSEKAAIFGFTVLTYIVGIFTLWYAMRTKHSKNVDQHSESKSSIRLPAKIVAPKTANPPSDEDADKPSESNENEETSSVEVAEGEEQEGLESTALASLSTSEEADSNPTELTQEKEDKESVDLAEEPLPDQTEGKTEEEQTEPASAKEDLIAETDVSTNHDPAEISAETKEPEESLVLEDSATQEDVLK